MVARSHFLLCLIIVFTTDAVNCAAGRKHQQNLNALWNLEEMAECKLHHSALAYNDYGCWCGIGGCCNPVDPIDDCCMHHDKCYDAAVDAKKCYDDPFEYIDPYVWKCDNGTIICGENQSPCKAALCACDNAVVNCWALYGKPASKPWCRHKKTNSIKEFLNILDVLEGRRGK